MLDQQQMTNAPVAPARALKRDQLDPLTGLRGIAAYSVLVAHAFHHAFLYGSGPALFHDFASRLAYFGMSLFFVLSGFVIHYNYAGSFAQQPIGRATWQFFVARFARLYPLYAVAIFISLSHVPAPELSGGVLVAYLTLTQMWINAPSAVFQPTWSISAEWFFYFAFPPLLYLVRGAKWPVTYLLVFCALALTAVLVLFNDFAAQLTAFVQRWIFVNDKVSMSAWGYIIYMGPLTRLLEFIAGMLAAEAYFVWKERRIPPAVLSAVLVISSLWCAAVIFIPSVTSQAPLHNVRSNFLYAPALAAFMVGVCLSAGLLNRWLSSRPLLFMGEISYSVYIWSFFAITLLAPSFRSTELSAEAVVNSIIKVLVAAGLTTVFAYGSYLLIEMPARRWLRAVLGKVGAPRGEISRPVEQRT